MARIRTIKPEMWESEKLGRLSLLARLTFIGLISLADDEGRGRGGDVFLLGRIHPYAQINSDEFKKSLQELEIHGLATFYQCEEGCSYYSLHGFKGNQYIEKPRASEIPIPPSKKKNKKNPQLVGELVGNDRGVEGDDSPLEGIGREGKGRERKGMDTTLASPEPGQGLDLSPKRKERMDPISVVVRAYKEAKHIDSNNKDWDRKHYAHAAKRAKELLDKFDGNVGVTAAFIIQRGMEWDQKGLDWGLEGIIRATERDYAKIQEVVNGREHDKVGPARILGSARRGVITPAGEIVGEALEGLRPKVE